MFGPMLTEHGPKHANLTFFRCGSNTLQGTFPNPALKHGRKSDGACVQRTKPHRAAVRSGPSVASS